MAQEPVKENNLVDRLQKTTADIYQLAEQNQGDIIFLLFLLRNLESVHRQIRSNIFEPSLPETRNDLYALVKDIEEQGGWPYIERMKLQSLLKNLKSDLQSDYSNSDHLEQQR